jgi:rod shape-determining protein MreD
MKESVAYILLGMALVVLRTTILGLPFFHDAIYDLLIPVVVSVRLHLPVKRGLFVVLFIGYMMDLASGGQFGLYMTTYLWVFIGVKLISNYVSIQETLSLSAVLVICVLFENLLLLTFSPGSSGSFFAVGHMVKPLFWQVLFAAITGPFFLSMFAKVHERLQAV